MKVIVKDNESKNAVYDLSGPDAAKTLKEKPFQLKEGCNYKIQLSFKCQHEIITGKCLRFQSQLLSIYSLFFFLSFFFVKVKYL